jgi:RNA polymerase sigma-70 factor (ECF subfamily)
LRSREDARDIIQDVFLSFFKSIHTIELGESLAGYLFTAVRNRIFNHFEKQTVRLKTLLAQPMNPVQSEELIWSNMRTKELKDIIAAEIRQLPPKMREIYQLSRDEQLTIGEIAELLVLSPQTVKNQLYQALQRIRIALKQQNLDSFLFFF